MLRTATLTAALATAGATSHDAVINSLAKTHQASVHKLLKMAEAAPSRPARKDRKLGEASYLNWAYYSSGSSCTSTGPYGYSGVYSGGCLTSYDGTTSAKGRCSGDQDEIEVEFDRYNNADCSGSPADSRTVTIDGSCAANPVLDDDYLTVDDRANSSPGFLSNYAAATITCSTTRNTGTFLDRGWYTDSDCETLTSYIGWNTGVCLPGGDDFSAKASSSCGVKVYESTDCSGSGESTDIDDDREDDDYVMGECNIAQLEEDDNGSYGYGSYAPVQGAVSYGYESPSEYSKSEWTCSKDDDGDDDVCFAGSETVLLQSGAAKALRDVTVGDAVQVVGSDGSLSFSEVVFLPHGANTQRAAFTEIQMASGKSLRATPTHLVMAGECGADAFELTAMQYVTAGRCVQTTAGEDEVTGSGVVVDHGVYTMVTKESSGLVVVNGVHASSFGGNHWLVNQYYHLHRAVYEVAPSLMTNRDVIAANLIVGDVALSML